MLMNIKVWSMRVEYLKSIKFFKMEIDYNFQSRYFQRFLIELKRELFLEWA